MKKNKFLRLASFMLIACLATCCAVGGTFAKYVTSADATDSARVAKWGMELTVTGDDAFGEKYNNEIDPAGVKVVSSESGKNVLAPGTNGTLATYSIKGTPEVAFNLAVTVDLDLGDKWVVNSSVYCPLVFNVGGTEIKIDATNTDTAKLETAVENAIKTAIFGEVVDNKDYEANATAFATAKTLNISWAWAYSTSAENDVKDTALGDAAADGNAPTIEFTLEITATQID